MSIRVYVDGAARPNPGKGGIGVCFRGNILDYDLSEPCPGNKLTNNEVEYYAFNRALAEMLKLGFNNEEVVVSSDSEMLVLQMRKEKTVSAGGAYVPQYQRACQLIRHFPNLTVIHIPREQNSEANLLASRALKKGGR